MAFPDGAEAMAFIVTRDRDRARAFYGDVLGFPVTHEDAFALVFDLAGTMLRISTVPDHAPQPHTVLGWEVADIAEAVRGLRGRGIAFRVFDGFGQDDLGIWAAPGSTARIAWFADPDGNLLSLAQLRDRPRTMTGSRSFTGQGPAIDPTSIPAGQATAPDPALP